MVYIAILWLIIPIVTGCNYYQDMVYNQQYYFYNDGYPNNYGGSASCKWTGKSPTGTKIIISCDIQIPYTQNCNGNRLSILLTGDLANAQRYCGTGSFTVTSQSNTFAAELLSTSSTNGGRFICSIRSTLSENPVTPSPINTCSCGRRSQTRIVGGVNAGVNEFPFMAALINLVDKTVLCSATIISDRYCLTAAHCVYNKLTQNLGVLVGDHDISTGSETAASALYQVSAFLINQYYNPTSQINDIAIVQTAKNIILGPHVEPICLPFQQSTSTFVGANVIALGWGTTEYSGPKSDILQKVSLTVISNTQCQAKHPGITPSQMCTYAPGKDACQSDSGGPLAWLDPNTNRWKLVGVISYGLGCATENPGVNTRVTSYLQWITSSTRDATYCALY